MANIALLIAAIIWGSSFLFMKDALNAVEPFTVIAIRFSIATIVLAVVCFPRLRRATRTCMLRGLLIGAIFFLPYCLQTFGLTETTPGKNAFLTSIYSVAVPFLYWIVNRTRPDRYNIAAALLLMAGVGLVALTQTLTIGWGDALTLMSGVFFAAHIVAIAKLQGGQDPFILTLFSFISTTAFAWIGSVARGGLSQGIAPILAVGWPLIYLALMATALGLLLQMIGQRHTDPSSASIIMGLEAVFGVLFSVIFGYEQVTVRIGFGFAVIFCAVLVSELKPWSKRLDRAVSKYVA